MSEIERLADIAYITMSQHDKTDRARRVVRAVLTAMREPSDDTIWAGFKGWMSLTELGPEDVWQAMIDHILNQDEGLGHHGPKDRDRA